MACNRCNDTGWVKYDNNHSTVCEACCKHDKGWWLLTKHYGNAGKWCCGAGCGMIITYKEARDRLLKENNGCPIYMTRNRER